MRLIYLPKNEEEKIGNILKTSDKVRTIIIASEYGKYKKGDYVKTLGGERLVVSDAKIMKNLQEFKNDFVRYPELKDTNLDEIKQAFTHKKVEIIELRKYR
ncbi:MAG: hypothetical protein AABW63_00710 [Nanoarchaeota archaeon]